MKAARLSGSCRTVLSLAFVLAGWFLAPVLLSSATKAQAPSDVPVFQITPVQSTIKFGVQASVPIQGTFKTWDATLTNTSTGVESGVLSIKIQADSVDTGSGMKDGKLEGKDFFNVKDDPYITFKSTKIVQTGPTTFEVGRRLHDSWSDPAREAEVGVLRQEGVGYWHGQWNDGL